MPERFKVVCTVQGAIQVLCILPFSVCLYVDRAGATRNGGYFAVDSRQRLLAEEAELDRMVKELQATLPPSEGQL